MGAGNPTISGKTETQVQAACQPRQPHKHRLLINQTLSYLTETGSHASRMGTQRIEMLPPESFTREVIQYGKAGHPHPE